MAWSIRNDSNKTRDHSHPPRLLRLTRREPTSSVGRRSMCPTARGPGGIGAGWSRASGGNAGIARRGAAPPVPEAGGAERPRRCRRSADPHRMARPWHRSGARPSIASARETRDPVPSLRISQDRQTLATVVKARGIRAASRKNHAPTVPPAPPASCLRLACTDGTPASGW